MKQWGLQLIAKFEREFRLLALLSARTPEASPFLNEFASGPVKVDWTAFHQLVRRHRVGALAAGGLDHLAAIGAPAIVIPDAIRAALVRQTQRNARDFMTGLNVAHKLTSAMAALGIDSAVLKGIPIAAGFYGEPARREMIDIDMVIPRQHLAQAVDVIRGQGFERSYPEAAMTGQGLETFLDLHCAYSFVRPRDKYQLDLHWRFMKNPALLPWLDEDWQGLSEKVTISDRQIPVLRPGPHFIYVMVHGAKHGWVRLRWLADIDRMLPQLSASDLAEAIHLIEEGGLGDLAASTCMLVRDIFGTDIPAPAEELISRHDGRKLHRLGIAMLMHELPGKTRGRRHWKHYRDRARNSLGLVRAKGYRRRALLQEAARPTDLAQVPLKQQNLWMLGIVSPMLAIGRAAKRAIQRRDAR